MSISNSDLTQENFQNSETENKPEFSNSQDKFSISLSELSDDLISNLIGLNVEVTLKIENRSEEEKVKGNIFSILKSNNLLILLKKDEKEQNSINSYMINIESIKSIKLTDEKFDVS
jgi:hypothetical protein